MSIVTVCSLCKADWKVDSSESNLPCGLSIGGIIASASALLR